VIGRREREGTKSEAWCGESQEKAKLQRGILGRGGVTTNSQFERRWGKLGSYSIFCGRGKLNKISHFTRPKSGFCLKVS